MRQPKFENILKPDGRLDASNPEHVGAMIVLEQEAWRNANNMECAAWAWKETEKYPEFRALKISL